MDLFLDDVQGLEKFAQAFTRLSENSDDWEAEIINELYRQAPYIGDFEPKLVMNELDPERRYAMASVQLSSRTTTNPRDNNTQTKTQGVKQVMVPVIVKDGKMFPLDVFISNGKSQPMTKERLNREMFRPELFETVGKRPGDQDMMNTLYPPYRSGGFGLGGNMRTGSMSKTSSADSILDAIQNTIKVADVRELEERLNDDPTLRGVITTNEAVLPSLQKLSALVEARAADDFRKTAAADFWRQTLDAIPPKVVQISKTDGGFFIKTANADALAERKDKVDRPTAISSVGHDIVRQVERDGTVTVATEPTVRESLADAKISVVKDFGEYKVRSKEGKEIMGWVFPNCVDLDGTTLALSIFSNGSQGGFQENIAGSLVGKGTNLIDEDPKGNGFFYLARQGGAVAIVPVKITGESQDVDGLKSYMVKTIMGDAAQVKLVPGLAKITEIKKGVYGIPEDCGFMPLETMTTFAEDTDGYVKTAQARSASQQIEVMYNGSDYSLRGLGLTKIAAVLPTEFIDSDQTVFNLAVLGMEPSAAQEKMAEARKLSRWVEIDGVRPVTLAIDLAHKSKLAAASFFKDVPGLKNLMLKEAASLDDPMSVDKVLSVGFLNPENIGTFVSYLPEFEDTLQKLSELLVAARMGLNTTDPGALERVVKHLDKVIGGLRELSQHPKA